MVGKITAPLMYILRSVPVLCGALLILMGALSFVPAHASDLPLAAGSPLAGFSFDDRPLMLPVQRNFQMAMLTAGSELGRSCGKMEAYGWRVDQQEQQRVNQIFSNTVDRMRALGYQVQAQAPTSVSQDITMFTADRSDKHFLAMWSAGEIGLVMVLCQTSAPMNMGPAANNAALAPSVETFPQDVVSSKLDAPKKAVSNFSPVGDWVGGYTCEQGYTGGTLQIAHLKGENFDGIFKFYPTPKNPTVPSGRYTVTGQYDRESQRILINPGKWLERPKNFYNTVMVGGFDATTHTFSAYFQGINGCTSFEAKRGPEDYEPAARRPLKAKPKKKAVKKSAKAAVKDHGSPMSGHAPTDEPTIISPAPADATPAPVTPPAPQSSVAPIPAPPTATPPQQAAPSQQPAPAQQAAPALQPAPPQQAAPASVAPPPQVAPSPTAPVMPPVDAPSMAPSAPAPAPATTAPTPVMPPAGNEPIPPAAQPAPADAPKPSGALEPSRFGKPIMVASGEWFTPTVPQAPPAQHYNTQAPQAPTAQMYNTYVPQVPPAPQAPIAQQAPQANVFTPDPPQAPTAQMYPTDVPQLGPAPQVPDAPIAPPAQMAPPAVWVDVPPGPQTPQPVAQPNAHY